MFIGHYGPAIWDGHSTHSIKLWQAFLAVQAIDIVFCALAIMGVEGGTNPNVAHPLAFNIPVSHSFISAIIIALLTGGLYRILQPRAGQHSAKIMAGLAFSHWPLDWLVHRPDLPLYPGSSFRMGLGLWDYPWFALALEIALFAGLILWWLRATRGPVWTLFLAGVFVGLAIALQFLFITGPTLQLEAGTFDTTAAPDPVTFGITGLLGFAIFAIFIGVLERFRETRPR